MKLIERQYLEDLQALSNTPDIKVITGIRRSGKSKLMEAFMEKIAANVPDANIIHINYNLDDFDGIRECHKLNELNVDTCLTRPLNADVE